MSFICLNLLYQFDEYFSFRLFLVCADLEVLQNIKEGIQGHAANWYSDVFDLVFPDLDHEEVNKRWKELLAKPSPKNQGDNADENDD